MRFTTNQKIEAELDLRRLNDKAQSFYEDTDPLWVYKVDGLYYIRGSISVDGLTFSELETMFCDFEEG